VIAQVSAPHSFAVNRNITGSRCGPAGYRPVSKVNFPQVSVMCLNRRVMTVLSRFRRAREQPPAAAPTMLEVYGARKLPDLSGFWVYALGASTDGHIWYVGLSESLKRRLDEHEHVHPDLWDPRQVYLIPADSEPQACIRQLTLIDFYQPEHNTLGTTEFLRKRVASLDKPAGKLSRSLDSGKAAI
jgi:hypothetical protein